MKNKRGFSTVLTILIMVFLVLVAIGIIWVGIKKILETNSKEVEVRQSCLSISVKPVNAEYKTGDWCEGIDFNRDTKIDEFDSAIFTANYEREDCVAPTWCEGCDLNRNGKVGATDIGRVSGNFGRIDCTGDYAWSRITLKRGFGGGELGGVKITFIHEDSVDGKIVEINGSVIDFPGNMMINKEIKTVQYGLNEMGITAPPTKVRIIPYVEINGKERVCPQAEYYEWVNEFITE